APSHSGSDGDQGAQRPRETMRFHWCNVAKWACHCSRAVGLARRDSSPVTYLPRRSSSLQRPLLDRIQRGEIDPSFVVTHRLRLDQAPEGYDMFLNKEDDCVKVVMTP
ncbi:MAG TPA: hypothetical protein VFS51_06195, partial [Gemmatimonadales bacterium]|nr:hypothetical protein [Gemmatimonadales bacterium]